MKKVLFIILGILLIITGCFSIFRPFENWLIIGDLIGIAFLIGGISYIYIGNFRKKLHINYAMYFIIGILEIIAAIILIASPILKLNLQVILASMNGIFLAAFGVSRFINAFQVKEHFGYILVTGILFLIAGLMCFFNPLIPMLLSSLLLSTAFIAIGIDMITLSQYITE